MEFPHLFLLTQVASTEGFVAASVAIALAIGIKDGRRQALAYLAAAAALMLAVALAKELFAVARMDGALVPTSGYAFPSGHAAGVAFFALSIAYLARNAPAPARYGAYLAALLFALLVGASRVAYLAHTPIEVGAGFLMGALFALLFFRFAR